MPDDAKITAAVDAYVRKHNSKLKQVADAVRALVRKAAPQSRENINPWGVPTFESNGPFCYLMIGKNHITFGFPRGTSLLDSAKLLEGTGKNLRHVKLREVSDVHDANLRQLVIEACALNRVQPLGPAMRAKEKSANAE
jgi:hypothetical protein